MSNIGGILTASAIEHEIYVTNHIIITPYDSNQLGINSYDLRIGDHVKTICPTRTEKYWGSPDPTPDGYIPAVSVERQRNFIELDIREKVEYEDIKIPETGLVLEPNTLYLIPTQEYIRTDYFEPLITGRSSMGRMGIQVHCEAGFGDIGFAGCWTLQVKVTYPTRIYPGSRMAQVYFLTPHGDITKLYHGKYQNATDALGTESYKDFQ